jgi:hypothetical protein
VGNLSGAVERITFCNPENGCTVLRLLPELSPGEHVRLQGLPDTHPKHSTQFKAELCEQSLPGGHEKLS